ncbi:uncharacterized protein V1518DRAFT_423568 [Limtongia smithiae]|uniref:uncharacterized protein n=1 Tax=Limtongia smithiae TaxID=1125753 RepID=UPI0034CF9335
MEELYFRIADGAPPTAHDAATLRNALGRAPDEVLNAGQLAYTTSPPALSELEGVSARARFVVTLYSALEDAGVDDSNKHAWTEYATTVTRNICECLRPFAFKWHAEDATVDARCTTFHATVTDLLTALAFTLAYTPVDALVIEALATYSYPANDPWCTPEASALALALIDKYTPNLDMPAISCIILTHTLRPLFQSTRHKFVSDTGRVSKDRVHELRQISYNDSESWSSRRPEAASILHFILANATTADTTFTTSAWSLLVPSTLAVLDDPLPAHKTRGCELLRIIFTTTSPDFVMVTGLAPVFWDTLMTCLAYLPLGSSSISVPESVALIDAALGDLVLLATIRARGDGAKSATFAGTTRKEDDALLRKYLGLIVIDGIYRALSFRVDEVALQQLFITHLARLATALGIAFASYLERGVGILVDVLSEPFATLCPPLVYAALDALGTFERAVAKRIVYYRFAVLKGLLFCWRQAVKGDGEDIAAVKRRLQESAEELKAVVVSEISPGEWDTCVAAVCKLDSSYSGLFKNKTFV